MFSGKPLRWKLPFNKVASLEFIVAIYLKTSSTTGFLEGLCKKFFLKKVGKFFAIPFLTKLQASNLLVAFLLRYIWQNYIELTFFLLLREYFLMLTA